MIIKRQPWGNKIIIYIDSASREETADKYYWFWHYSVAALQPDTERVDWLSNTAVRFFTTPEKYLKGVATARLFHLINNHADDFKGVEGGAFPVAQEYARKQLDAMEWTTGYKAKRANPEFFGYDNTHGKAENLSDVDA